MAKQRSLYICQSCGFASAKWLGKCPECQAWNAFLEESSPAKTETEGRRGYRHPVVPLALSEITFSEEHRIVTGLAEFDRVCGGGIVSGSLVLIGGDPGIGKSTLLLQAGQAVALKGGMVLYVSGEESPRQIKVRADRLGVDSRQLLLLCETDLESIIDHIRRLVPKVTIIDSIQTTFSSQLESGPGSVSQIRECAARLMYVAKEENASICLIGHVTKEGTIAGPRVLEHIVDTVLYFEGERNHAFRILRTVKNRFGSTNEIGVFEMREQGLVEVANPSQLFLAERTEHVSGSVVIPSMEGTRPVLVELQALVSQTQYGVPQRVVSGIDRRRLSLILAVLEKRAGLRIGGCDVYVNVAGGIRIDEPAVDLGTAVCVASSFRDIPLDPKTVVLGEVGLGGEVRAVSHIEKRIGEAAKLGFKRCVCPERNSHDLRSSGSILVHGIRTVEEALECLLV